ncbi:hypothetical protein Q8A73_023137 [Channa argus]|nr:hypothetical protein Q8A73_023137 [Channa argus]
MPTEVTLGREASEEGDKTSNIVDDIGSDDEFQILVVEGGKYRSEDIPAPRRILLTKIRRWRRKRRRRGGSEVKELLLLQRPGAPHGETRELSSSNGAETTPSGGSGLLLVVSFSRLYASNGLIGCYRQADRAGGEERERERGSSRTDLDQLFCSLEQDFNAALWFFCKSSPHNNFAFLGYYRLYSEKDAEGTRADQTMNKPTGVCTVLQPDRDTRPALTPSTRLFTTLANLPSVVHAGYEATVPQMDE